MLVRWSAFADLSFAENAGDALARSLEETQSEAAGEHASAWVLDGRRASFSVQAESPRHLVEGLRRLLSHLVLQAVEGEAIVEIASPRERWARRASTPSVSKELLVGGIVRSDLEPEETDDVPDTIRTIVL